MASLFPVNSRLSRWHGNARRLLYAAVVCMAPGLQTPSIAQLSTTGNDFIFAFLPNSNPDYQLQVNLVSENRTTATIEYPVGYVINQVTIEPGRVATVLIPKEAGDLDSWTGSLNGDDNSVRVSAPEAFSCFVINSSLTSSDGAVAIPVHALNNFYLATTYDPSLELTEVDHSVIAIVAAHDSTVVTVTPSNDLVGGHIAAEPFTLHLSRGKSYLAVSRFIGADGNLTGTIINANRPVTVVSGNKCARVPIGTPECDHSFEIAQPLQTWGKQVLTSTFPARPSGSVYRILTAVPNNPVYLDGDSLLGTIDPNQFIETDTLGGSHIIHADYPIFVTQFMTGILTDNDIGGDPSMANMPPVEQFRSEYVFSTPDTSSAAPLFTANWLTVFIKNEDLGKFSLDGNIIPAREFTRIGQSGYATVTLPIKPGFHKTKSDSGHSATLVGVTNDNSYMYPVGTRLEIIHRPQDANPPVCTLQLSDQAAFTANGSAEDSRRQEDLNSNGLLEPGEDRNQNGRLDQDSGVAAVALDGLSTNVRLVVDEFIPGDPVVTFRLSLIDTTQPGTGIVNVVDLAGNSSSCSIEIPVCKTEILSPADGFYTIADSVRVIATSFLDGNDPQAFSKTWRVNGRLIASASGQDTLSLAMPLDIGTNSIVVTSIFEHATGHRVQCSDTVTVTRVEPPACNVQIVTPRDGANIPFETVNVTAALQIIGGLPPFTVSAFINGVPATVENDSIFATIPLETGANTIIVTSTIADAMGQVSACSDSIVVEQVGYPLCSVKILQPTDGDTLTQGAIQVVVSAHVFGGAPPYADSACTINGLPARRLTDSTFVAIIPLEFGENIITATCSFTDVLGQKAECSAEITIVRIENGPECEITILEPAPGAYITADSVRVRVLSTVPDRPDMPYADTTCIINNFEARRESDSTFVATVPLEIGENLISVICSYWDFDGKETSCSQFLFVNKPEPLRAGVQIARPADGDSVLVDREFFLATQKISGGVQPYASVEFKFMANGVETPASGSTDSTFSAIVAVQPDWNTVIAAVFVTDSIGTATAVFDTIRVFGLELNCDLTTFSPQDSSFLCEDSVAVYLLHKSDPRMQVQETLVTVNGDTAKFVQDLFVANVALEPGYNTIIATAISRDALGREAICSDTTVVFSDPTPPEYIINFDNLPTISGTLFDYESGIASVEVVWVKRRTVEIDSFEMGAPEVNFVSYKPVPGKRSGFMLKVTNRAGCVTYCDPVEFRLIMPDKPSYSFDLPQEDHYLLIENFGIARIEMVFGNGESVQFITPGASPGGSGTVYSILEFGRRSMDVIDFLPTAMTPLSVTAEGPDGSYANILFADFPITSLVTSVQEQEMAGQSLPTTFALQQNYPNPFNMGTTISFDVPAGWSEPVQLSIVNINGQRIRVLANGHFAPGSHSIVWHGDEESGRPVASGVYFYRLHSRGIRLVRKLTVTK